MTRDAAKLEEAALIRSCYNEAIHSAYQLYCDTEEIAANALLEVWRLQKLSSASSEEERDRLDRIEEKQEILVATKQNLHFILAKIRDLARERDKFISDIYMSHGIIDLEEKLADLTPWIEDLSTEIRGRANAARLNAKISSEIARAVKF
ncbi:MAG: hypothetical protein HY913_12785 [Desulfomonile tiedjei]|nr:hypothetical protein [Desulfomonile tiedjei]